MVHNVGVRSPIHTGLRLTPPILSQTHPGNIKERIGADKLKAKQEELDEVFERLTSALAAKELAEAKSEQLALSLEQHQAQLAAARDDATAREHEKQHGLWGEGEFRWDP